MSAPVPAIDLHSHFWPEGLLKAAASGTSWFGWRPVTESSGRRSIVFGQRVAPFDPPAADLSEAEARAAGRREQQGIALETLMPVGFLWNYDLPVAEGRAFAREMNEELAAVERAHPTRFRALGYLPMQDTQAALDELEHAVKELGLRSFAIGTNIVGRNIDDPLVLPVIEAVADAGVSLNVHPPYWDKLGEERFPRYRLTRSFGAPLEAGLAVASIVFSGVLDRKPDLRLGFTHGGGVMNTVVGRLGHRWRTSEQDRTMERPPEEYLRMLHYDCLVHDEDSLRLLVERAGHERVMVGTDFPFDGDHPGGAAHWIRGLDWLDDAQKEDVLWRNAARFLDLPKEVWPR